MKNILVLVGSASHDSSNLKLVNYIARLSEHYFKFIINNTLNQLPHFNTEQSTHNTPAIILEFRKQIENADGVLFCTPEYIFSIPAVLKNAIEWCVSTTVFSHKPVAIITASADGEKGMSN